MTRWTETTSCMSKEDDLTLGEITMVRVSAH